MLPLLFALACGAKTPPEGSTELSFPTTTAAVPPLPMPVADGPVPPGGALPFNTMEPSTPEQLAFLEGESLLFRLEFPREVMSPADSHDRALEAMKSVEEASALFGRASAEEALAAPSMCRAGDAHRYAARVVRDVMPPLGVPTDNAARMRAESEASAAKLEEQAAFAYLHVLRSEGVDPRWQAHARWSLTELGHPELAQEPR